MTLCDVMMAEKKRFDKKLGSYSKDPHTVDECLMLLVVGEASGTEQSSQHEDAGNANLQQGQALILGNIFDELVPLLGGPIICSSEIVVIPFRQFFSEGNHATNDPCSVPHDGVSALTGRGIERVDNIGLEIGNRLR